jgi:L-ascorbate metabolism protein UlaG (beta-lactamase superfamily)
MAEFLFQGHGSYRFRTNKGTIIYVDPYAGSGYDIPADIILVTHQHGDHNRVDLITKKTECILITQSDALKDNQYQSFIILDVEIEAVPAYNQNHKKSESVGYILRFDGISFYASGDTSLTDYMVDVIPELKLDYAVLPIDGIYNMNPEEATQCANIMKVKHVIPIHMKPGELFCRECAEKFTASNRLIIESGENIIL